MPLDPLAMLLSQEVYRVLLVFVRVGGALVLMPGFGELAVPARIRLALALVIAAALAQVVPGLPATVPGDGSGVLNHVAAELLAGSFVGLGCRLFLSALQVAGGVIGQAIGLSNPFAVAGTGFEAGSIVSGALVLGGVALIFAADLHYLMLDAILHSYALFPAARMPDTAAMAQDVSALVAATFRLGVGLAAPFLAFAVLFNFALGLVNRAMPAMPVFFIGTPAMVMGGLAILVATSGAILAAFADGFGDWLRGW